MIPQSERHDTGKMYKKLTIEQLEKQIPEVRIYNYILIIQY